MSDQSQRTEKPTPRRLDKARREGRFAVSRELAGGVQFLAFAAVVGSAVPAWASAWREHSRTLLEHAASGELTADAAVRLCRGAALSAFAPLALPMAAIAGAGIAAQLMMTRGALSTARLAPDVSKLNGFRRLAELPKQAPATIAQTAALLTVLALALRSILAEQMPALLRIPFGSADAAASATAQALSALVWKGAIALAALGLIDFVRERRKFDKQMRMTKQEVREELKESEGDPLVKQRVRRIQRDLARRNMMKQVPTATAVIVNPTHYAIAIRYALDSPGAPTVVAKGKNYLARRIREIAEEHKIPIIENRPLAQALYKGAEVGQEIPAALYRAVAEVLAYIYKILGGKLPG